MATLDHFTDDELRAELSSRERAAAEAYWRRRIAEAKWLCPDCGMPDSAHTLTCRSDTSA